MGANKKGFVSIYALILLNVALVFNTVVIQKMKTNIIYNTYDEKLDYVEIFAINKAKKDLYDYKEKDETISYLEYEIELVYDDITCYITISKNEKMYIKSSLEWDDIEEKIVGYTYL